VTLLICPVRPGESNEELRYALRSWQTNLIREDGLELMTVGFKPSWLEPDMHVPGNRHQSVPLAVFDNIMLGAAEAMKHHNYDTIFMNDDFFCLDPVPGVVPVRRNRTLREHIDILPRNAGTWWPRSMRLTLSFLQEAGYPDPWSYDLHRPLSALPSDMYEALRQWNGGSEHWTTDMVPQWRTVYGVLNEIEAYPVSDVKLGIASDGFGSGWISTTDLSWRNYRAGITKRFPETSRWERR
jgi:hypothetical protein